MEITKALVEEAMRTSHDACKRPEGCIHAHDDTAKMMFESADRAALKALATRAEDPAMFIWFVGFHVGFRLAQLMYQPVPTNAN